MDVREGLPCLRSRILLDVLLPLCKTHRHDVQRKARPHRGCFCDEDPLFCSAVNPSATDIGEG